MAFTCLECHDALVVFKWKHYVVNVFKNVLILTFQLLTFLLQDTVSVRMQCTVQWLYLHLGLTLEPRACTLSPGTVVLTFFWAQVREESFFLPRLIFQEDIEVNEMVLADYKSKSYSKSVDIR